MTISFTILTYPPICTIFFHSAVRIGMFCACVYPSFCVQLYVFFSHFLPSFNSLSLSRLFSVYHLPNFKSHKQKQKKLYDCFFTNEIKVKCGSCCSACNQRTLAQKEPYTLVHQICILYFCVIQMIVFRFFCQSKTFNRRYW